MDDDIRIEAFEALIRQEVHEMHEELVRYMTPSAQGIGLRDALEVVRGFHEKWTLIVEEIEQIEAKV